MKKFSIYTNNVKFIYLNFGLTYTQHCGFYKNQGEHTMHKQPSQKKKNFLLSVQNIYITFLTLHTSLEHNPYINIYTYIYNIQHDQLDKLKLHRSYNV